MSTSGKTLCSSIVGEGGSAIFNAPPNAYISGVGTSYYGVVNSGTCTNGVISGLSVNGNSTYKSKSGTDPFNATYQSGFNTYLTNTCVNRPGCTVNVTNANMGGDPRPYNSKNAIFSLNIECNSGYIWNGTSCVQCPAGSYLNGSSCTQCAPGWYSTTANTNTTCTHCPDGKTSPNWGTTALSDCVNCPPGQYSSAATNWACSNCPAGQSSSTGASSCSNCPAGQSSAAGGPCMPTNSICTGQLDEGATATLTAPANASISGVGLSYYGSINRGNCTNGLIGNLSVNGNNANKATSASDPFGANYLASFNTYLSNTCVNRNSCTVTVRNAEMGDPWPNQGKKAIISLLHRCNAGYSWNGTSCLPCRVGQSSTAGGTCTNCPAGQSSTAGGTCAACPAGQSSAAGGPCLPIKSICAGQLGEGGTATLTAPANASISGIGLSYYGQINTGNCTNGLIGDLSVNGNNANKATSASDPFGANYLASFNTYLSNTCLNRNSCTVTVRNTEMGDPWPFNSKNSLISLLYTCNAGYYADVTATTCSACPSGTHSAAGATSCTTNPPGTYSAAGAGTYTTISPGSYLPGGTGPPTTCPAGFSCAGTITLCPAGTYSPAGVATCSSCPSGQTSCPGSTSSSSCYRGLPCVCGSTSEGASTTVTAPANSIFGTTATSFYGRLSNMCSAAFSFIPPNASTTNTLISTTATNNYINTTSGCQGNSTCTVSLLTPGPNYPSLLGDPAPGVGKHLAFYIPATCKAGNYLNGTSCTNCPAGTYSTTGVFSLSECIPCNPGTYSAPGAAACTTNPPGFWSGSGAGSFIANMAGFFTTGGSGTQVQCPAGYSCSSTSALPTICPAGTYSPAGAVTCMPCEPGTYAPNPGAAICLNTPANYYSGSGAGTYAANPAGYYSGSRAGTYAANPAGYYSAAGSGSSICPAGYSCSDPAEPPVKCLINTYSVAGQIDCSPCPGGTFSSSGAASCMAAPIGTYAPVQSGSYIICPPGSYCPPGAGAPVPCPPKTYGSSSGLSSSSCSGSCPQGTYCQAGFTKPMTCMVPQLV